MKKIFSLIVVLCLFNTAVLADSQQIIISGTVDADEVVESSVMRDCSYRDGERWVYCDNYVQTIEHKYLGEERLLPGLSELPAEITDSEIRELIVGKKLETDRVYLGFDSLVPPSKLYEVIALSYNDRFETKKFFYSSLDSLGSILLVLWLFVSVTYILFSSARKSKFPVFTFTIFTLGMLTVIFVDELLFLFLVYLLLPLVSLFVFAKIHRHTSESSFHVYLIYILLLPIPVLIIDSVRVNDIYILPSFMTEFALFCVLLFIIETYAIYRYQCSLPSVVKKISPTEADIITFS